MTPPPASAKSARWSWRSQAFRALVYQVVALTCIALLVWYLAHNTATNMRQRGIQSGFDFLLGTAGFDIGESLYAFDSGESYFQAYLVGVTNTLRVALLGIVLTTVLGTLLGVGRFARNALVRGMCRLYVEAFRNIPVLLQLLMWYLMFTELLPEGANWLLGRSLANISAVLCAFTEGLFHPMKPSTTSPGRFFKSSMERAFTIGPRVSAMPAIGFQPFCWFLSLPCD